jgi:hypothetical protein
MRWSRLKTEMTAAGLPKTKGDDEAAPPTPTPKRGKGKAGPKMPNGKKGEKLNLEDVDEVVQVTAKKIKAEEGDDDAAF